MGSTREDLQGMMATYLPLLLLPWERDANINHMGIFWVPLSTWPLYYQIEMTVPRRGAPAQIG